MNHLLKKYREEVRPELMKEFGYKSIMQVPRLEKIVVNIGVGDAAHNSKLLDAAMEELAAITGQNQLLREQKIYCRF